MPKPDAKRPLVPSIVWIAATLVCALLAAQFYGRGVFFLVVGAAVLLTAIAILWKSVQALTGDAPLSLEEALSMAAPSTEEERKASVLRALKDLEYERSVGKLSEEDYRDLTRKYRQEAKQLLLLVDESMAPARQRAEALLEARLLAANLAPAPATDAPRPVANMPSGEAPQTEHAPAQSASTDPLDDATSADADSTKQDVEGGERVVEQEAK